jgi:RNA-directed DNA polymerase
VSLRAPESVQKLQTALHAKAKEMPTYRFYALYDKLYREDILAHAWRLAKANGGAAGVDGQTFQDIEGYGVERWLGELAEDLRKKTYRPQPVRRVYIPKPDGRKRPLGIKWHRRRQSSYCHRSSKPTCNRSSMRTGRGAMRTTQCAIYTACSARDIGTS